MIFDLTPLPENPVFVVGYPRAGTTFLQSLLATQEGFMAFRETHFFSRIMPQVLRAENGRA
jgi:hypothetical protein